MDIIITLVLQLMMINAEMMMIIVLELTIVGDYSAISFGISESVQGNCMT